MTAIYIYESVKESGTDIKKTILTVTFENEVGNIEKKTVCRAWKKIICLKIRYAFKKMLEEKSAKLLKNISSETEIKNKSNKFCYKFY